MSSTNTNTSSSSNSPGRQVTPQTRRSRDSDLCQTSEIPIIDATLIDNLTSYRLGRGTYGFVEKTKYRRSRKHEWKLAAVKYANESPIHLSSLIREAKIMMQLRTHAHVIKIYGLYQNPRHGHGVVMEYMDCGSMADLVYRNEIEYTIDHFASWMYQLADAVDFFHSHEQLHRDLKLQNMLLCNRYRTMKLCDFGTYTAMHQSMTSNRGTPITMAPEVFRCEPYNTKSDIFSIGIIMWQLIARREPYNKHMTVPALLFNVASTNLRPPELPCSYILSGFYKRCWHEDPAVRPTSVETKRYFELLKTEYPRGDQPLVNMSTHRQALTPEPKGIRKTANMIPSSSNNQLSTNSEPVRRHIRTTSDKTNEIKLDVPAAVAPKLIQSNNDAALRGSRSQSVAANLHNSATNGSNIVPHREAPPPPSTSSSQQSRNSEESGPRWWFDNPEFRPVEPDVRSPESMRCYQQHSEQCELLGSLKKTRNEWMVAKHEKLQQQKELLIKRKLNERLKSLRLMIEREQAMADDEDHVTTERM